jgi:putative transposase
MPRLGRLEFKGAIYSVQLRGPDGAAIFFDASILRQPADVQKSCAPHLERFEHLVDKLCLECAINLYAYCVEPNRVGLTIRTDGLPLHLFIQRLSSQYSRYLRMRSGEKPSRVWGSRYVSRLVAPEYLPHAVRRIHRAPFDTGSGNQMFAYPFSSACAYLGAAAALPLLISPVMSQLAAKGYPGVRGYRAFMNLYDSPYVVRLFEHGAALDPRIVGSKLFVSQAHHLAAHPVRPISKDDLIAAVAGLLATTPAAIHSSTPTGILGRALVAWYGLRSGAATLTEMARWFEITGATLGQAMHHHRLSSPDLFRMTPLLPFESNES